MLMYASTHPWRATAVRLCGAASLALVLGLAAAAETGAPALVLASDAVVMPSATPLAAEPASTELDVPAADGAREPLPSQPAPPTSSQPGAAGDAAGRAPAGADGQPMAGPAQPANGDLDCADFAQRSFPIDPANDPNNLDADGDGIACEPPPGDSGSGDLDCADFAERSFRIDPANDPHNLDADGDGIACEPPPDE